VGKRKRPAECYMCDSPAVSREHVPPLCLFPEPKDIGGKDYRRNLITVPSCDEHNSKKKCDDEFLMVSMAGIIGNNSIRYRQRFSKVDRAIRAGSSHLLALTLRHARVVDRLELEENKFLEFIWGTPDLARLNRCFEHIAYGLHWHHFGRRFDGRLHVHLGYLTRKEHNDATWDQFVRDRAAIDLQEKPPVGANRDVFYYQFADPDPFGFFLSRLQIYGGLQVLVGFQPSGVADATHFGTALLSAGVRTIFRLGDRRYEFNPGA